MRSLRPFSVLAIALIAGFGCESERGEAPPEPVDPSVVALSTTEKLVRVSMAIRGLRPSVEELERVAADPAELSVLVDRYLDSDAFGSTIRDLYNEALKVRVPASLYPAGFAAVDELAGESVQRINVSVTEAPLRLIEHVVRSDRPLTEIVTADYVLADGYVAKVWGLAYEGTGESWETAEYSDGRPHAGILSDSWLYTRHSSTFSNKNRGRANAIARGLLCHDFVERHVELDATIDLADPEQVNTAIETNPSCASCHQTLDPLAAFFGSYFPLFVPSFLQSYPMQGYMPELIPLFTVKEPGYFGYPGGDVKHLGQMIARDPRFALCQTRRFYSYFRQVPLAQVPETRAAELNRVLLGNMNAKELVKAIVLDESFLVSHRTRDDLPGEPPSMLKIRPWQLASSVAELSGFRWQSDMPIDLGYGMLGRVDLMTDSLWGFEVLNGGIDAVNVALPSHTMNASASIVQAELAVRAADHVVEADARFPGSAKLFTATTPDATDEAAVREQLARLQAAVLGELVSTDSDPINDAYALFQDALAEMGDAHRAWKITLSAMLQHPRMVFY
jgi:hypothetical protein